MLYEVITVRSSENRMFFPQGNEKTDKTEKVFVFFFETPVNPGEGAVMAVGVIVPFLGPAEFIACGNHGYPL